GLADEGAQERSDARHVLHRTAVILEHAQQMARQDTKLYEDVISQNQPGLGRAFTHQMLARELFQNGHYQEATFHSLHARVIALRLMEQIQDQADLDDNGDDSFADEDLAIEGSNLDELETGYWDRCPAESQMTFGMNEWNVSDDDALSVRIELNF
ncbi:MAG TPA: hypothetical protein VHR47_04830, partial [Bacillota bacterium]|nr:hypothetical protein [Bacillota bacterium]